MILLADVGNSQIKWVFWDGVDYHHAGRAAHDNKNWDHLLARLWARLPRPSRALIVSVAGVEAHAALTAWMGKHWHIEAEFIFSTTADHGIRNAYAEPGRLGADRWVAMIAAHAIVRQVCYVVDCGTAVTIDALAADGQHLGGVILPGIRLMRESLFRATRQIPPETGEIQLFGDSTRDGVWGGAAYAVAAAIDGIIDRMVAIRGSGTRLLTGGDAEAILPYLLDRYRWEPDLIFIGLRVAGRIFDRD